jgi:uncharacterized Zn finger protein
MALLGVDDPVHEPDLPAAPAVEIEVLVCPHCDCPDCEVWSTTEARMANCPECGAMFSPPVNESKTKQAIRQITESRQRMRRKVAGHPPTKMEFQRILK